MQARAGGARLRRRYELVDRQSRSYLRAAGGVPVSRASLALALALLVALRPAAARAYGVETPAAVAQPEPSTSPAPRPFDTRFRLALLGDYRSVTDLSAFGGGIGLSLGRADDDRAGQFELRALTGWTAGGLTTFELGVGASGEIRIADSFFLGVGAGAAVRRSARRNPSRGGTL